VQRNVRGDEKEDSSIADFELGKFQERFNSMYKRMRLVVLLAVLVGSVRIVSAQAVSSVSPSRIAHLRHGINASEWFAQVYGKSGYTKEHFQNWTDWKTLR
jgi:hypothetical protein